MKTLKFHFYDMDTQEIIEITDTKYERLEHLAKTWNMTIQDVTKILIANFLLIALLTSMVCAILILSLNCVSFINSQFQKDHLSS